MTTLTCSSAKTTRIVTIGQKEGVLSWTDGFHPTKVKHKMTEDDVLANALYLAKHGRREEGEELIERFCSGHTVSLQ